MRGKVTKSVVFVLYAPKNDEIVAPAQALAAADRVPTSLPSRSSLAQRKRRSS
jgi:hypothetical protein